MWWLKGIQWIEVSKYFMGNVGVLSGGRFVLDNFHSTSLDVALRRLDTPTRWSRASNAAGPCCTSFYTVLHDRYNIRVFRQNLYPFRKPDTKKLRVIQVE